MRHFFLTSVYIQLQGYCYFSSKINKCKAERQKTSIKSFKVFHKEREAVCTMHGKFISARAFNFQLECTCYTPAKEVEGAEIYLFGVCGPLTVNHI